MKPSDSNAGPLQLARRRLRAVVRRHPARAAALGGATVLAGALALVILQSHTPMADEMTAAATNIAPSETAPAAEPEAPRSIAGMLENAKLLPVAEAPRQQEAMTADPKTEEAARAPLTLDEARWSGRAPAPAADTSRALADAIAPADLDRDGVSGNAFAPLTGDTPALRSDRVTTAAISPQAEDDTVQVDVAENEADVAALEQAFASRQAQGFALAAVEGSPGPDLDSGEAPELTATGTGIVDRHVNLRAEADNDATILAVVPQNSEVAILDDCPNWCAVEYEGHQGYIFGTFIERETTTAGSL